MEATRRLTVRVRIARAESASETSLAATANCIEAIGRDGLLPFSNRDTCRQCQPSCPCDLPAVEAGLGAQFTQPCTKGDPPGLEVRTHAVDGTCAWNSFVGIA